MTSLQDTAIFTSSYAGDFESCKALARSIDALMPEVTHYLAVSWADRKRFAPLLTGKRKLIIAERVLPEFLHMRLPSGRYFWVTPYRLWPLKGWYFQQFLKFAVVSRLTEQAVLMVDSDVEFIRPLDPGALIRDGRVRLVSTPFETIRRHDINWARASARLFDAPGAAVTDVNYVENLIVWHPGIVRQMLRHIAEQNGMSWKRALLGQPVISEYCHYGKFVDHVPGPHQDMVFRDAALLCHTLHYDFDDPHTPPEDDFVGALGPDHIAFGIQSNIRMAAARHRALTERLREAAKATV